MIDMRPVFLVVGVLVATLGCFMLLPALYELAIGHEDWLTFATSAMITLFVGIGLAFANRGRPDRLNLKQAFLLTNLSWLALTAFGALPFTWTKLDLDYTDAFFEAMSGITTTGATVIDNLGDAAPGILLWRGLLQWLGGLGIIVMAISILPLLQIGGMQLFRVEGFEAEGRIRPRATQLAGSLSLLYLGCTALCATSYRLAGMNTFDAVVHSMTTIATGGFSNYDASIAHFSNDVIEIVAIVFMIVGSLPFVLYFRAMRGSLHAIFADTQVQWFFAALAIFVVAAWFAYQSAQPEPLGPRTVTIVFNVTSIMTGTGYATTAYDNWSSMAVVLFFCIMFVGGCSGSTSCGIKIFRFEVIFQLIRCRLRALIYPNGVFIEQYSGRPVPDQVTSAVMSFFLAFLLCFGVLAAFMRFLGYDHVTALSAAASAIANVGPGLGSMVGPAGNYSELTDMAKWALSAGMLLGRLEIFTVLVLFSPAFWRS